MSIFDMDWKKQISKDRFEVANLKADHVLQVEKQRWIIEQERQRAFQAMANNSKGLMQNIAQQGYSHGGGIVSTQNMPRQAHPFGQLYLNGAPLPAEWRGAEYAGIERSTFNTFWELRFSSKWSGEYIYVHLDLNKHSDDEVNKLAQTFLEVINQRRVG